ncbi:MAG: MlaD family protein [Candidatus Omnitrophota bacterium]
MDGRSFELRVGIFVLVGIIVLFIIVFSIGDVYFVKTGYCIDVVFKFASGIGVSAPVRVAGVDVGLVEKIDLFYDTGEKRTMALASLWIRDDVKLEKDSKVTINTLGLLGEKYVEISPGTAKSGYLKNGEKVIGYNPVAMEDVTENLKDITESILVITERLKNGDGTIGKLMTEDAVYGDLKSLLGSASIVAGRIERGEGTIGKLLKEEKIYNDLEAFVADIKKHPWKLLGKPRAQRQKTTTPGRD